MTRAQAADTIIVAVERPRRGDAGARRTPARRHPVRAVSGEHGPRAAVARASCPVPARSGPRAGALLVFDEVISGFRVSRGGAQGREAVLPDLTVLGKVVGGGLPAGAFAGRADLMRTRRPRGPVYQAGTLSGNPLADAAGLATLAPARRDAYRRLDRITAQLAAGLGGRGPRRRCPRLGLRAPRAC